MLRKEKGMILFENKQGKQVGIDLNQHCWIGVKGVPVKTPPSGAMQLFSNYYYNNTESEADMYIYTLARSLVNGLSIKDVFKRKAEHLKLIERLTSMGLRVQSYYTLRYDTVEILNKHFKELVEYLQEGKNWREMVDKYRVLDWFKEHNIPQYQQYDYKFLEFVHRYFCGNVENKYISQVIWYIQKERIFEMYQLEKECDEHKMKYNLWEDMVQLLRCVCQYAEWLNLPKLPKNDIRQTYAQLMHTYTINKDQIDTELLTANQLNHNLEFAFGDYIVIVPTTLQQFRDEANQQNNCVYRMYLKKVIGKETNVVFIRHKDNLEKSVVTCEVRNGIVWQFLLAYNNGVYQCEHPDLYAFRMAYQEYLDNNFKK